MSHIEEWKSERMAERMAEYVAEYRGKRKRKIDESDNYICKSGMETKAYFFKLSKCIHARRLRRFQRNQRFGF